MSPLKASLCNIRPTFRNLRAVGEEVLPSVSLLTRSMLRTFPMPYRGRTGSSAGGKLAGVQYRLPSKGCKVLTTLSQIEQRWLEQKSWASARSGGGQSSHHPAVTPWNVCTSPSYSPFVQSASNWECMAPCGLSLALCTSPARETGRFLNVYCCP